MSKHESICLGNGKNGCRARPATPTTPTKTPKQPLQQLTADQISKLQLRWYPSPFKCLLFVQVTLLGRNSLFFLILFYSIACSLLIAFVSLHRKQAQSPFCNCCDSSPTIAPAFKLPFFCSGNGDNSPFLHIGSSLFWTLSASYSQGWDNPKTPQKKKQPGSGSKDLTKESMVQISKTSFNVFVSLGSFESLFPGTFSMLFYRSCCGLG